MNTNGIAWKILVPVVIGLGVVVWLFHREFNAEVLESIHFDSRVMWCIALAWLFMIGRELGLSWRFRAITDRQLSWWQSVKVTMLCEFTSCITPTSVGGSALGMVFMNREGIELGRATSLMMTTLFLDELFFVISLPVIMAIVPYKELFGFSADAFTVGLETVFWIIYGVIFLWTLLLFLGIFVRPRAIHSGLNRLFRLKCLRRWAGKADELGQNMEVTAVAQVDRATAF